MHATSGNNSNNSSSRSLLSVNGSSSGSSLTPTWTWNFSKLLNAALLDADIEKAQQEDIKSNIQVVIQHMIGTGAISVANANSNIIKINRNGKSLTPVKLKIVEKSPISASASGSGIWSMFGTSSNTSANTSGVSFSDEISDNEVAGLELQTQTMEVKLKLNDIEINIEKRNEKAKYYAILHQEKGQRSGDIYKKRALNELQFKKKLSARYITLSSHLMRIEEIQFTVTNTVLQANILQTLTDGTKMLKYISEQTKTMEDDVDDIINEFNDLKVEINDTNETIRNVLNADADADANGDDDELEEEFNNLGSANQIEVQTEAPLLVSIPVAPSGDPIPNTQKETTTSVDPNPATFPGRRAVEL